MKPHKHAEIIKAWADGAEIQYQGHTDWYDCAPDNPDWDEDSVYRVKPIPKPDMIYYGIFVTPTNPCPNRTLFISKNLYVNTSNHNQIKMTFDGETGKLKSVEIVK